jgi:chromosome segregation ATPase
MAPINDGHDDIHRRLSYLEEWRDDMNEFLRTQGEARLNDYKEHTLRLAEVHEKVNSSNEKIGQVRTEISAVKGWAAGGAAIASIATGIIVFLLDRLLS